MLNVKTAVSLDVLADELINDLKKEWKSPFEAPVVIFAENKIEQWFKLKWLQKQPVLANLNTKRLDSFLLEVLSNGDKTKKILSGEILRNLLLAYLTQKNNENKYNYEALDATVKRYLEDDGVLNELRLFDFTCEISNLFKDYEITRPSEFKYSEDEKADFNGFIETWKKEKDNSFFKNSENIATENEDWQYKLYCEIFQKPDSLVELVNGRLKSYQDELLSFFTLPQLYEKCRDSVSNKIVIDYKNKLPIYVFGLSGIGQFYRVVLQKLAENNEINLFIQSPVENISNFNNEKCNNELLKKWGKAGIENIELWKNKKGDNIINIANNCENKNNCLLNCIKNAIVNNTDNISEKIEESYPSISITTASSRIREVENLHSNICRLLNGSANNGKPAKFSDILVVAPNIEDYKTAILEVFAQAQTKAEEERDSKNKTVVSLPFNFVDSSAIESLTSQALHILFLIREKGALARPEFFALVRNPVVQKVRNIKNEDIKDWERWITDMNIYRDRTNSENKQLGWLEAAKRLLLARFSSEPIIDGNDEYIPYANIASGDNDSLCSFIDCVESLENWINKDKWLEEWKNGDITGKAIDYIMDFLGSWLFMKEPPKELTSEAIIFRHIKDARESLKLYFATGNATISWKIAHFIFLSAAINADYNSGSIFTRGITFMKFAPNRSIPVKYLFMLGTAADAIPGRKSDNSLDLRDSCIAWRGDVSTPDKNRFAFLSQLLNTSDGLYLSYVNKDLQKDEDFYPSSVISDIRNFLKHSNASAYANETEIMLDETRDWKELFTKREIRNKTTQQSFNGETRDFKIANSEEPIKIPSMVKFYSLKGFLQDPFEFQINRTLGIDDTEEDPEKTEFEPVDADFLNLIKLEKMLVALGLGIKPENKIATKEELKKKAIQRGWIPDDIFSTKAWNDAEKNVNQLINAIVDSFPKQQYTYYKKKITVDIPNNRIGLSWKLLGEILIVAENSFEIHFISISKSKGKKKNFLDGYIAALALLCIEPEYEDKSIGIDVFSVNNKGELTKESQMVNKSSFEAEKTLNDIYEKAYCDLFDKVLPLELFTEKNLSYSKFIEKFDDDPFNYSYPWKYFTASKIFNVSEVCGFSENDFKEKWAEEVEKQRELMTDLWPEIYATKEAEK